MPRSSRNRESGSQRVRGRSRHSGRSQSHHRSRHGYGTLLLKHKERNFIAAICSMTVIVIMCSAIAEPDWIYVRGGGCNVEKIGVHQFFFNGYFDYQAGVGGSPLIYHYGSETKQIMVNCVSHRAVSLLKAIISFTFMGIACSLLAFFLDLFGPIQREMKLIRRNAIPSIATVIICVVVNGFCYWLTLEIENIQKTTKTHKGSQVLVTFDVSFYLIAAAGGMAVLATACNCLRRYSMYEEPQADALLNDVEDIDILPVPSGEPPVPINMPPPPAYSP